jgi:hypothetical protein
METLRLSMRRLLLTLLCGLIVIPVAAAATHANGDGVLELKSVDGSATIGSLSQPAKGALWGQLDSGSLTVYDPVVGDGQVYVSGWESRKPQTNFKTGVSQITYSGTNLHFRVTGGQYKLLFANATSLDLTAVGVGVATLLGDSMLSTDANGDPGYFAIDSGKWVSVPTDARKSVSFGTQTTVTSSP